MRLDRGQPGPRRPLGRGGIHRHRHVRRLATALNARRAALLASDTSVEQLDDWRAELADIEQVAGTRFYDETMRRRRDELQRLVREATGRLMQAPDLQAMLDLPRSEDALRAAWDGWTIGERRAWLRRRYTTSR
jgi:hypothetical protein